MSVAAVELSPTAANCYYLNRSQYVEEKMNPSAQDYEEIAVDMLSTLSLNGSCALEILLVDGGFLVYQETAEEGTDLRAVLDGYISIGTVANVG